jgi:hypothetical protein
VRPIQKKMNSVRYNLKFPKKERSFIMMIFYFSYYETDINGREHYKYLKYSTGLKIPIKFWDFKSQRLKKTWEFPAYPEYNQRLEDFAYTINLKP